MRTLLLTLSLAAMSLLSSGCKSRGDDVVAMPDTMTGTSVYTKVGMHFDVKDGRYTMYSTNYVGLNKHLPPGTHLTYQGTEKERLKLTDDNGSEYLITFEPKHSMMTFPDWVSRQWGEQPFSLPADLTDEERAGIEAGEARIGMSRAAVFLAIGYPPKSLNPSESDDVLTYQRNRFVRYTVRFGADDKVVDVSR
ncbi:MAG: hypothetical protein R3F29_01315 [Planctomycetota bacterium]